MAINVAKMYIKSEVIRTFVLRQELFYSFLETMHVVTSIANIVYRLLTSDRKSSRCCIAHFGNKKVLCILDILFMLNYLFILLYSIVFINFADATFYIRDLIDI